jgi:hypothetical protein
MIFVVVVVVDVDYCAWFCTHGTIEIGRFVVLLCVWSFASLMMLTVDSVVVSQYMLMHTVENCLIAQCCELYSSHIETKILAMNVTFK